MDNTSKGQQFVFTAKLAKTFKWGLSGSLAYTYTFAQDITANNGSQASSVWTSNQVINNQNELVLANSSFGLPHRIVGTLSYRKEYVKHLATQIGVFFQSQSGSAYSFVYNGDLNNDGNSTSDLMYIPSSVLNSNEIKFKDGVSYNGITYTSAQQAQLFEAFIDQDPYLKKHKGQIAERNGARLPWYTRVDLKFQQDVFHNVGKNKHTVSITADCVNFLNLLSKYWGIQQRYVSAQPLKLESVSNGVPLYSYNFTGMLGPNVSSFANNISTSTTWALQIGVKYSF